MLKHRHLVVRCECSLPPVAPRTVTQWTRTLIESIGMKIMMGPYAAYCDTVGNRGVTCCAVIETSHVAVHVWDETAPSVIQLDVYSCSDFAVADILDHLQQFEPVKVDYKFLDRDTGLREISHRNTLDQ